MENEVTTLDGGETSESAEQKQNKGKIDFNKPLWKSIFLFFLPLMLSNTLNSISGTISSIILGRIIGVTALAAVSAFFPILFLLISFVIGVGAGSSVLIGQAFGAQEWKKVKVIVGTTLTSTFLIGLIVAIPGYFFTYELLELTGTPADVIDMSAGFARITFIAMPVVFFFVLCLHYIFQRIWGFQYTLLLPGGQHSIKYPVDPCTGHRMGFSACYGCQWCCPGQCYSCTGFINRFSSLPEKSESPTAV